MTMLLFVILIFAISLQRATRGWCEKMIDVAENSLFQFVLSPKSKPATLFLMKRCKWASLEELNKLEQIEVCPKAMELTETIATRLSRDGDSLQAIRKQIFVHILDNQGTADLSAYVVFASIRHSAEEASGSQPYIYCVCPMLANGFSPLKSQVSCHGTVSCRSTIWTTEQCHYNGYGNKRNSDCRKHVNQEFITIDQLRTAEW
ncbi:Protein arginine methyltransferase NDUFAF7 [Dillenia turbinata]|uniref:Protein arginine methyltransferase NDUFAF7 n=1 Tax=Dillenia turbinata TaxID=194707 RepID=A0AAN8VDM9_9MAGN